VGRIFGRGELSRALLVVIASIGEGHGYTIMQQLEQRVGGGWKASPGAIYPALLTLQDAGLVEAEDRDGSRIYRLTQQGRNTVAEQYPSASWESLSARAEANRQRSTLARLLRDFQADLPEHRMPLMAEQAAAVARALATAAEEIKHILTDGGTDG
jgi:DNA-binding PadR family transcriptional regulator